MRASARSSFRLGYAIAALAIVAIAEVSSPVVAKDARSVVLFERRCESDQGSRLVTLFANGTIRLRNSIGEHMELFLAELAPEEVDAYRAQLAVNKPSDGDLAEIAGGNVEGLGVERCTLIVAPEGGAPIRYVFSPLEVPSLRIDRWLRIAEALTERALPKDEPEALDEAYEPRVGHILRDVVGERYRIVWVSVEGWIELDGLDLPIHIQIHDSDLGQRFVAQLDSGDDHR